MSSLPLSLSLILCLSLFLSKDLRIHRFGRLHRQVKVQDQSESRLGLSPLPVIVSPENTADVTEATDGSGIVREG